MNRLVEHINFLLFENDFIVVPEIGGFVINKEKASYDELKQILSPPYYWVGFNHSLTHNDGLLLQLYMKSQSLSSSEAEKQLEEDVQRLKVELYSKKEFSLTNLGTLYINKENNICFTSSKTFIRPQQFGLESLSILSLEKIKSENELLEDESSNRKSFKKILTFASATAAAALLLFAISIPISDKKQVSTQYASFFPEKTIQQNPINKFASNDSLNSKKAKTVVDSVAKSETHYNYYLIVGTFQTYTVADKARKYFQAKGYSKSGILESYTTKRIFVTGFKTANDAYIYLGKFVKENPQNKDAWVYMRKGTDKIL